MAGPPGALGGPSGPPRGGNGFPMYFPYMKPPSPKLMKLPNITKDMYYWDGDTSTLRSYIRRWTNKFKNYSPNQVVPFIRSPVPESHQWRLNKATNFQDCIDCLMVLVSSEDDYVLF